MPDQDKHYADDDARWQAVLTRDSAADGIFFYGVRSTGVYCRPTCASRRPKRANAIFFATAAEAERAGFRPCRKCHPNGDQPSEAIIGRVRELLEATDPAPTLTELGRTVGLSPSHLQRLFKQRTGLSPREYAASSRAERLKHELKRGAPVTDALYASGYGSARGLYDDAARAIGMTPGSYRRGGAGVRIAYAFAATPLGGALVAATARGLCALRFGERQQLVDELRHEFPQADLAEDSEAVTGYVDWLQAYLAGQGPAQRDLPDVDVSASAFRRRVWLALREIPYGETRSYAQVAAAIGAPRAVRAVAGACAANPVAVAIPCHRVVRADGDISGYRWGVTRKKALLDRERKAAGRKSAGSDEN